LALGRLATATTLGSLATAAALALLLVRLFLVVLAAVVGDVEARALEQNAGAGAGHAHRAALAARTALGSLVLDAMEQLETMAAFAAFVFVGRHVSPWSGGRARDRRARERASDGRHLDDVLGGAAARQVVRLPPQPLENGSV